MNEEKVFEVLSNPLVVELIVIALIAMLAKVDKSDKIVGIIGKIVDGLRSKKKTS